MRLRLINLENLFDETKVVTNENPVTTSNEFTPDGIYSKKIFGKNSSEYQYSCECGSLMGEFANGVMCNSCNTHVKKSQHLLATMAWIKLPDDIKVINPYFYNLIIKVIGTKFKNLLKELPSANIDGQIVGEKNGFRHVCDNLHNLLVESANTDAKQQTVDFLIENWDNIFTNKIPVCNSRIRPVAIFNATNEIHFSKINSFYNKIISCTNRILALSIAERTDNIVNPLLFSIQECYNTINDDLIKMLVGKAGIIRNTLVSNRVNFSSRCVITPLPVTCKIDEIHLPYIVCMELLKLNIINYIQKTKQVSFTIANELWFKAVSSFDEEIYEFIQKMLKQDEFSTDEKGMRILINRNPTISKASMLLMRLTHCKKDIKDLTMSISNNILSYLTGDFDGDVLNIFLVQDRTLNFFFKNLTPTNNIISSDTGLLNPKILLDKDYALGIYSFLKGNSDDGNSCI